MRSPQVLLLSFAVHPDDKMVRNAILLQLASCVGAAVLEVTNSSTSAATIILGNCQITALPNDLLRSSCMTEHEADLSRRLTEQEAELKEVRQFIGLLPPSGPPPSSPPSPPTAPPPPATYTSYGSKGPCVDAKGTRMHNEYYHTSFDGGASACERLCTVDVRCTGYGFRNSNTCLLYAQTTVGDVQSWLDSGEMQAKNGNDPGSTQAIKGSTGHASSWTCKAKNTLGYKLRVFTG